jgi:hypothetical protein
VCKIANSEIKKRNIIQINIGMTDHLEIQQEEIKVLECIYLNDIKILKSSPPFRFEIMIKPFLSSHDEISPDSYNLLTTIDFAKNYPEHPPKIEYDPISNITIDHVREIEKMVEKKM